MATVKHRFGPRDAQYPAANYAQYKAVSGTNFPVESLAFDASTEESAFFQFPAINYGSGNVTVRIRWYADTASTAVGWVAGCSIAVITPDSDTTDIETKAFAAEAVAQDIHLTTTAQRLHEMTVTVTGLDSLAAEDWVVLKLARKVADAATGSAPLGDTLTGDVLVVEVGVEYSDT